MYYWVHTIYNLYYYFWFITGMQFSWKSKILVNLKIIFYILAITKELIVFIYVLLIPNYKK